MGVSSSTIAIGKIAKGADAVRAQAEGILKQGGVSTVAVKMFKGKSSFFCVPIQSQPSCFTYLFLIDYQQRATRTRN